MSVLSMSARIVPSWALFSVSTVTAEAVGGIVVVVGMLGAVVVGAGGMGAGYG